MSNLRKKLISFLKRVWFNKNLNPLKIYKMTEETINTIFEINGKSMFVCAAEEEKESESYLNSYENTLRQQFDENMQFTRGWTRDSRTRFGKSFNAAFKGPTYSTNWVIPGFIMVGDYPETDGHLRAIQGAGITTFACLNVEYGKPDLKRKYKYPRYGDKLPQDKFYHLPIVDMNITSDEAGLVQLCRNLKDALLRGEKIYIHCSGGHGRTGTVLVILLKMLFPDLTFEEIFDCIQCAHDQRACHYYGTHCDWAKLIVEKQLHDMYAPGQVPSPQLSIQRNQAIRLASSL